MATYDLIILGAGPGGYVAAIRAAQLGLRTAVVEKEEVGGLCLNWGCIPSKALLRNAEVVSLFRRAGEFGVHCEGLRFDFGKAVDRSREVVRKFVRGVEFLLKKNRVDLVRGEGVLRDATRVEVKETGQVLTARWVVLATGARPRPLPALPVDGKEVITSREALGQRDLPPSILIVGGGATGCEFAYLYNAYGVRVTLVELLPHLLPNEDEEVGRYLERSLTRQGITVLTGSRVSSLRRDGGTLRATVETPGGTREVECGRVLVAVGVQGNVEALGLEEAGVEVEKGFIRVDDLLRTSHPSVYAIGDVTGRMPLAHVASAQGVLVAEALAGREVHPLDYTLMPRAVYCHPQVASWGLTERQAREAGHQVRVGKFPFSANGKALALGEPEGFVKVVVDAPYGELLGVHCIGPEVTELLPGMAMARLLEGTAREAGFLVHAHPTLSEAVKEAVLASQGEAVHI